MEKFDLTKKPTNYYSNQRPEMLKYAPAAAKKILDVGCAKGNFGKAIKDELKAEVWGIEINPEAAKAAAVILDKVLTGDVSDKINDLPDKYFDCVFFNDVLEHLIDPYLILRQIKNKLASEGVVVASLPNIRNFRILKDLIVKKEWKYQDEGILDKTHLRFFTKKSIEDMFNAQGYQIIKLEGLWAMNSMKYEILNFLTIGHFSDSRYGQFACVAKPKN